MNYETDRREESIQPGFVQFIEDDQMCYDQESCYYYQPQPHDPQSQIFPRPRFIIRSTLASQILPTTQYINIENLNKQQIKYLTATMEVYIRDEPYDEARQSQSYIVETDNNISGQEKYCLVSQEGDQNSSKLVLPQNSTDETFLCQVCYYDIKETRAFDCKTCLAVNSQNKICNFCLLEYLKETVKSQLQADEIVIKCPLNTCGKNMNFDQTLNQLLALQSYNAENKESHYSNFDEGLSFQDAYRQLDSVLFERFKVHCNDFKYCPAKDCLYGGYQDKKQCSDKYNTTLLFKITSVVLKDQ
eukprot:403351013